MGFVNLDFETYSEAGYIFVLEGSKWKRQSLAGPGSVGGLAVTGADVYARHPSTEIISLAYSLDGGEPVYWRPQLEQPRALLEAVRAGELLFAYNSFFEWLIWEHVGRRCFGWPELPIEQTRDTMAAARSQGLPGKLKLAAAAVGSEQGKGDASLIRHFCVPRTPSKNNPAVRFKMSDPAEAEKAAAFRDYNLQDVRTEQELARLLPPMSPYEVEVWKVDQRINQRGVAVDVDAARAMWAVVEQVHAKLNAELRHITGGAIQSAGQAEAIVKFFALHGLVIANLQAETVEQELKHGGTITKLPPWAIRVLEIRQLLGLASVKKLRTMLNRTADDGRVRGLFAYGGAERTLRWAGRGVQPQNMPRGNAKVSRCGSCKTLQGRHRSTCISCGGSALEGCKWNADAAVEAVASFVARPGFDVLLERWGDLLTVISSSLRGLFVAAPGHRLICSDYRAIEAVVLAALAGEQWRLDVFNRGEDIYLQSASKITGTTVEEYLEHAQRTGEHHPDRQLGKVAELASGYGGGIGAWKNFHADDFLTDEQIEAAKRKWREESPNIKRFWYKLEDAAKKSLRNIHTPIRCRGITYIYDGHALRCILPSGRALVYQSPSLKRVEKWGRLQDEIWFWGMNSNAKYGRVGVWMEMSTYGGKLCENVTQATARDIMAHGMLNTDRAGYPIVLHVHDEEVAECPDGFGTVEGLEACMNDLPAWARTDDGHRWPVDARGGWAGREYRKD